MIDNTKPTITLTDFTKSDCFSVELQYFAPEQTLLDKTTLEVSAIIFERLKDKIIHEVPDLLTYANFLGEAEEYMVSKGIPFNKKIRQEYAIAIRNDFIASLEDSISFDEQDGTISLSPYIFALEAGDFYRPSVQFITKLIQDWIKELEKASANSK